MSDEPATPTQTAAPSSAAQPAKVKTGADLRPFSAAILSFFNLNLEFYPRLGAPAKTVKSNDLIDQFYQPGTGAMVDWSSLDTGEAGGIDDAIDFAKASLEEAKAQTEYQDQKATRLLTVTTFLTALAGAFFTSFASDYPLRTLAAQSTTTYALLLATYLAFLSFVLCALAGALVTFHATRTRFKYPPEAKVASQTGPTRSYLFYREIIGVTPAGWAASFVTMETDAAGKAKAVLKPDLKIEYLKNYVSEAYLIAAKTADKLRFLQPAQSLLALALRCLLVFVLLLAYVLATLPPTKPPVAPSAVKLVEVPASLLVRVEPPAPLTTPPTPKPTRTTPAAANGKGQTP